MYITLSTRRISTGPPVFCSDDVIFMLMASGFMAIRASALTWPAPGIVPVIR
jgi:hypothetical protein